MNLKTALNNCEGEKKNMNLEPLLRIAQGKASINSNKIIIKLPFRV